MIRIQKMILLVFVAVGIPTFSMMAYGQQSPCQANGTCGSPTAQAYSNAAAAPTSNIQYYNSLNPGAPPAPTCNILTDPTCNASNGGTVPLDSIPVTSAGAAGNTAPSLLYPGETVSPVGTGPTLQQVMEGGGGAPCSKVIVNSTGGSTCVMADGTSTTTGGPSTSQGRMGYSVNCQGAMMRVNSSCSAANPAGMAVQGASSVLASGASSACAGQTGNAIAALGAAGISLLACPGAYTACTNACNSQTSGMQADNGGFAICQQIHKSWEMQMAVALAVTGVSLDQALNCTAGTTAVTPPPPGGYTTPTGANDPTVASSAAPIIPTAQQQYEQPSATGGGAGAAPGAYPGGAGQQAGNGAAPSSLKDVSLGTSNAGGGGWPTSNGGAGWPGAKPDDGNGKDLMSMLQCQMNKANCPPDRGPASVPGSNELSKADGLTNFQKATRKYNEWRPTLPTALLKGDKS